MNTKNCNKYILVTGGTGYIGSHTVVELQNKGYDVVIVDNLSRSNKNVIYNIEKITGKLPIFEYCDCCDYNTMLRIFNNYNISAIIHFAAYKCVGESVSDSLMYYENNLIGLINILKLANLFDIKNIVFSSSCTVYGQPDVLPVTEDTPLQIANCPYGNTKQICEEIIRDLCISNKNINAILLRYFNPIGAHPSGLIGELPIDTPQNLLPYITQTAIGKRECLSVFGNDYNTPDGSCIRDYIDVVDLAKAHIIAIERLLDKKNDNNLEIYNLGTGKGLSVLEIIKIFENVSNIKLNYKIIGRRPGDVEQIYGSPEKANKILNWYSTTPIEETILNAWRWEQNLKGGN